MLKFETKYLDKKILSRLFYRKYQKDVNEIIKKVRNNIADSDYMMGWSHLKNIYPTTELIAIRKKVAEWKRLKLKHIVIIGIGGSYTGVKAGIDMVLNSKVSNPELIWIHNMDSAYLINKLRYLKDKKYGIIVISKSGRTLEPAIAFRLFRKQLESIVGINASKKLIVAITDSNKGTLHDLAKKYNYSQFNIPSDIGGRYSSLTPVGIFPYAIAGLDINKVLKGASDCLRDMKDTNIKNNHAYLYACIRHYLYNSKKLDIEQFNVYQP